MRRDLRHTTQDCNASTIRKVCGSCYHLFSFYISHFSELLSIHEHGRLLDEEMTEKELQDLEEAEEVCRRFLAWDLEVDKEHVGDGGVKRKLAAVLGKTEE